MIKQKLKTFRTKTERFLRAHPFQFFFAISVVILLTFQLTYTLYQNKQEYLFYTHIKSLPSLTLYDLQKKLDHNQVQQMISHIVSDGSYFSPKKFSYLEIISDKKHYNFDTSFAYNEELNKILTKSATEHKILLKDGHIPSINPFSDLIRLLFFILFILFIISYGQKLTSEIIGGHNFKPSRPDLSTTLDNVIGYDYVKQQLYELKEQLLHYTSFTKKGIYPPKGILFTGDPGVGKTLMAKAFANEINADFFYCTGADFVEMYVGVGAKRVRSLFKMARLSSVAVIFIDEIDALGSRETMGQDTERLNTLNAILAEMDGINSNKRIVVIGATNFPEKLDKALKRPGRFDTLIQIPLPDLITREAILTYYLKDIQRDPQIDLHALALRTHGYSGAQLKNIVLEATRLAVREQGIHQWKVTENDLLKSQEITLLGTEIPQGHRDELIRVAVHELGHALIGYVFCPNIHIEKVTTLGLGSALGYAFSHPKEESSLYTREQMESQLKMLLAGRAAEEVIFGQHQISNGSSDDLNKANNLVKNMVLSYGMGEKTGLLTSINQNVMSSSDTHIVDDITSLLQTHYVATVSYLQEHQTWILKKALLLLEKKELFHHELFQDISPLSYQNSELMKILQQHIS